MTAIEKCERSEFAASRAQDLEKEVIFIVF